MDLSQSGRHAAVRGARSKPPIESAQADFETYRSSSPPSEHVGSILLQAAFGGQRLTTGFMGGLFSLDGIHPTNTGYAIIANEFIKTMNRSLLAGIPPVSVEQVNKTDPLIFPESDRGKHTGHVNVGMADGLRVLGRR